MKGRVVPRTREVTGVDFAAKRATLGRHARTNKETSLTPTVVKATMRLPASNGPMGDYPYPRGSLENIHSRLSSSFIDLTKLLKCRALCYSAPG